MKTRVIPTLTLKDGKLVKTKQFSNPRNLNSPITAARVYNYRNVDEMVLLNIGGPIPWDIFEEIARDCFMPLSIGGGITTMEDVKNLFTIGADKVVIRTHTELIPQIADKYGSQAVIYAADAYGNPLPIPEGTGEIMLTSIPHEGLMVGYNCPLIKATRATTNLPIIANGGCGEPKHALEAIQAGADAVAAASIFTYTHYTPNDLKRFLSENGISVRLLQSFGQ